MQLKNAELRQILNPSPDLSVGCDSTIHSCGSFGTTIGSGFSGSLWDSHVLLAACERRGSAWEVDGHGLFTRALLEILDKNPVNELTYRSLMDRLLTSLKKHQ